MPAKAALTLVPAGANWKYFANGTEPGPAWQAPSFNDSTWLVGPAQLGFGEGDEATVFSGAPGGVPLITAYFRHVFNHAIASPSPTLTLRLLVDDGAIVYLNGVEVLRSNMPVGPVNANTLALTAGVPENVFIPSTIPTSSLVAGANVIAVEVHQASATSSDISFDLELLLGDSVPDELPVVNVEVPDGEAREINRVLAVAPNPGLFRLVRSGPVAIDQALTVNYQVGGSAENGIDYAVLTGIATIPAGSLSVDVLVSVIDDELSEGTETVELILTPQNCDLIVPRPPGCYRVGMQNRGSLVILDDEAHFNRPPTVQVANPADGTVFPGPLDILLHAMVDDPDGASTVQTVEFFEGTHSLGVAPTDPPTDPFEPFVILWTGVPPGTYALTAVATDHQGAKGTSAVVRVTVLSGPGLEQTLIAAGSVWRYLDNGSDQGTAWRQVAFSDATWLSGAAQLGYGDGDEATVIGFGPDPANKYVTTYFRRGFVVVVPDAFASLRLRVLRDDGVIVYLNGIEVFRDNMPLGPVAYNTLAPANVFDENAYVEVPIPSNALVAGQNVIAAEVHQVNVSSSDLGFDLALLASGSPPDNLPVITVEVPDGDAEEVNPILARPPNPGLFRLVRSGPSDEVLKVTYQMGGTAANGVDYVELSGEAIFAAGTLSVNLPVDVIDDSLVEGPERVDLILTPPDCLLIQPHPPGCYRVGIQDRGSVTIRDDDGLPPNRPPTVALYVTPPNGPVFVAPADITLRAVANDQDGDETVQSVEFFEGTRSLGIRPNVPVANPLGPYVLIWPNVQPGTYELTAVATDIRGAKGTSMVARVTVQVDSATERTLVASGAVWRYLDDGSNQGRVWRELGFTADATWQSGPAQLGYGDGDEATVLGFGPDPATKYITTYFRHGFEVADATAFGSLRLRVLRDDGVIVYLNGVEILRNNMPPGPVGYNTFASMVAVDENAYVEVFVSPAALISGLNVIAAEVHQVNPLSSDLGFDLALTGLLGTSPENEPPTVSMITPADGEVSYEGTPIRFAAHAADPDGVIIAVEVVLDGTVVAEAEGPRGSLAGTWTLILGGIGAGQHTLAARAIDNRDGATTSAAVTITVRARADIDEACPCADPWENHAAYVRCVIRNAWRFFREGFITAERRRELIHAAVLSQCGSQPGVEEARQMLSVPLTPDECRLTGVQFVFCGEASGECHLESSTDLIHWSFERTLTPEDVGSEIACPHAPDAPVRFFRVRIEP